MRIPELAHRHFRIRSIDAPEDKLVLREFAFYDDSHSITDDTTVVTRIPEGHIKPATFEPRN